jgi:glyoxylase-like metal-dependent hydrolase (beta-lactamase superfamily II)
MYGLSDHPNGMPWTRFNAERQGSSRYSTRIPVPKLIEHTFASPVEVEPGILRVTLPLPSGPRHVHCFLLRGDDGWTLVDTGLGLPEPSWDEILAQVDGPVVRIFITHMHPDHVGGAAPAALATGAPVVQGRLDYAQCERVWGSPDWPERIAVWFLRNGVPPEVAGELIESGHVFADFVQFAWNPTLVEPGDELDGWQVLASPGHADGHLCLHRDGVLIAGDTLLAPITPAIGLYPESSLDPLGDYAVSLHAVAELDPRVSYGGHGETIVEPAARAREILLHHDERLDRTEAALGEEPRTGYEVSHALFGTALPAIQRRFAVAEALSHLERLVAVGRAGRHEDDRVVTYTAR